MQKEDYFSDETKKYVIKLVHKIWELTEDFSEDAEAVACIRYSVGLNILLELFLTAVFHGGAKPEECLMDMVKTFKNNARRSLIKIKNEASESS